MFLVIATLQIQIHELYEYVTFKLFLLISSLQIQEYLCAHSFNFGHFELFLARFCAKSVRAKIVQNSSKIAQNKRKDTFYIKITSKSAIFVTKKQPKELIL